MTETPILVVDDEPSIVTYVRLGLEHEGFAVQTAETGEEALDLLRARVWRLIILDVMLPGIDGFTVCRRARAITDTPILLLTARNTPDDVTAGLDSGADAYLPKPFKLKELLARVHALLRRVGGDDGHRLVWNDLALDLKARQVITEGQRLDLTTREFALLRLLMEQPRKVHTHQEIMGAAWGEADHDARAIKTCVSMLRAKLGNAGHASVRSVRGVGYTLEGV